MVRFARNHWHVAHRADRGPGRSFGGLVSRREVLAVAGAALAGVLLLVATTRWGTPAVLHGPIGDGGWTGRTRAWFTPRQFYRPEVDIGSGRQFSWTGERARLLFPGLSRSQAYRLTLEVAAFRPGGAPPPEITMSVDGVPAGSWRTSPVPEAFDVTIPAKAGAGAVVVLAVSDTFAPGGGDNRALGVMVNDVRLEALAGHFRPTWAVMGWTVVAVASAVAAVVLCGPPSLVTMAVSMGLVVGFVWLLGLDAAFLGTEVLRLVRIATGALAVGAVIRLLRARWPIVAGLPEWAAAVGIVLGISTLKLACFSHPQIALTDALFQVHRAELVHRGEYFFTSVTPAPSFEFPYAVALYVAALPFWRWFPSELDLANLLRGLSLVADACVGVCVYAAARRQWGRAAPALLAAALWPLTRAPAMALGHANLTNLFGQSLFGVAMGLVALAAAAGRPRPVPLIAASGVLTLAFLSHFSTLSVGTLLVAAVGGALMLGGTRGLRHVAGWTLAVLIVGFAISYAVYYSHFTALYSRTLARVVSGADHASDTSMVASPRTKFERWITEDQFSNDYGLPGVGLFASACVGAAMLVRTRRGDGLSLMLAAWAAVWIGATALGILSSVELRANLAATPMFVWLAAYGLWALAARSGAGRIVAGLAVAVVASDGLRVWLSWLGRG
jgi:hypothetical protein